MSGNIFSNITERFKNSPIAIPLALVCVLGMAIAIAATMADYTSSYEGYVNLPTMKVSEVVWLIAMLPQVGQIIFATYFALTLEQDNYGFTRANWIYALITFFLFLWDNGTDIWFKTNGFNTPPFVWFIAVIESIAIYTVGSEVLLIISFGLFIYLAPAAIQQTSQLVGRLITSISGVSSGPSMPHNPHNPIPQQGRSNQQTKKTHRVSPKDLGL